MATWNGFPSCCQAAIIAGLNKDEGDIPARQSRVEFAITATYQRASTRMKAAGFRAFGKSADSRAKKDNLTFWIRGDASVRLMPGAAMGRKKPRAKKKFSDGF